MNDLPSWKVRRILAVSLQVGSVEPPRGGPYS